MAGPAAVQTTDGGGHRLGYLSWDYHERSPAEFATVFKDKVAGPLEDQSWFASKAGASVATQSGVIRTNCLDSLDRTNKVQTKLAYWNLPEGPRARPWHSAKYPNASNIFPKTMPLGSRQAGPALVWAMAMGMSSSGREARVD